MMEFLQYACIAIGVLVIGSLGVVAATCLAWLLLALEWQITVAAWKQMRLYKAWLQMHRLHRPFMRWLARELRYHRDGEGSGWREAWPDGTCVVCGEDVPGIEAALADYDPKNRLKWKVESEASR